MAMSDKAAELISQLEDEFVGLTTSDGWPRYLLVTAPTFKMTLLRV